MNRKHLFIILLAGLTHTAGAQNPRPAGRPTPQLRQERLAKIENAKIAFITNKLHLTTEQAQQFWPLYNEYESIHREARLRARRVKEVNLAALTDQQVRENINEMHAGRQNELNAEKQYVDKFLKVISVRQLAALYRSEREFTHVLLRKLDDRRTGDYGRR